MTSNQASLFQPEALLRLRARAELAAVSGRPTFAIPEAVPVMEFLAERVSSPAMRAEVLAWPSAGASYHELVRLAARTMLSLAEHDPSRGEAVYVPKAAGELEPLCDCGPVSS